MMHNNGNCTVMKQVGSVDLADACADMTHDDCSSAVTQLAGSSDLADVLK
jgi:hypothetical protein